MLLAVGRVTSYAVRVGCAVHFFHTNVHEISETFGESMLPTLDWSGDFAHVDKLCRRGKNCATGDVIIAAKPTAPHQRVCKRITGMAGDVVMVDPTQPATSAFIEVPQGHAWVTGDNLSQSVDSRTYGPLPLALIKGKVVAVSRGWHSFRWLPNGLEPVPVSESQD